MLERIISAKGLRVVAAATNTICAGYFLTAPTSTFAQSPIWMSVLEITGSLIWLGIMFSAAALLIWLGIAGMPLVGRAGLLVALLPLGAVATSFIYAAIMLGGLGVMTATFAAVIAVLHIGLAGYFSPHSEA